VSATHTSEPAVETAFHPGDELGEGVTWDATNRRLISVDILRGRIHLFEPRSGARRTITIDQPVGAAVPRQRGGLMLALRDGFATLDLDSESLRFVAHVELDKPGQRMNDGACDPAGRFWAGTMCMQERPGLGSLYRLDRDGTVQTVLAGVGISNGIDWNAGGSRMYYIDSLTQRIDQFDYDLSTGAIENRRTFVNIDPADGCPDGLTVDAEDGIWVALWGGSAIRRYLSDGTLDRVLRLPVTHPTTCAFGGPDLETLYITSATIRLSDEQRQQQPLGGAVIHCRPGVTGRAAHAYGG
jgi:sugar lactone lactonase YvrE